MKFLGWIIGGSAGGVAGAAIWAVISYMTDHEIGWIAWGVGVLAGLGVRMAAKDSRGAGPGVVAAIMAVLALVGGKFATAHFQVEKALAQITAGAGDLDKLAIQATADTLAKERMDQGKPLIWPQGKSLENASEPGDYPPGIWDEASKRNDALPAAERGRRKAELKAQRDRNLAELKGAIRNSAFVGSLGPYDLLWVALAIGSAYKLGSNRSANSEVTSTPVPAAPEE